MKTCLVLIGVALFVSAIAVDDNSSSSSEEKTDNKARPPFLEGADDKAVQDFKSLLQKSGDLNDEQIDAAVDEWVSKQGDELKEKYKAFKNEVKKHQDTEETAHKAAIAKLSADAKAADEKLTAIANNPALSAKTKGEKIKEIVKNLPKEVREEIKKAASN